MGMYYRPTYCIQSTIYFNYNLVSKISTIVQKFKFSTNLTLP